MNSVSVWYVNKFFDRVLMSTSSARQNDTIIHIFQIMKINLQISKVPEIISD